MPINLSGILSFGLLYYMLQSTFSVDVGAKFYLVLSLVFPPLILWSEIFTRRMEKISSTAEFELGLPMPSDSYRLLGVLGQMIQELARPVVAVQGSRKINQKISEISEKEELFNYLEQKNDGSFHIDHRVVPIFQVSESTKQGFVDLVDFLVKESVSIAGRTSKKETDLIIRNRVGQIINKNKEILIKYGLLDRLGKGIFSHKVSSGLSQLDLMMDGGYPKQSAILICGPPSDERNLILNSFIGTGLSKNHSCLYVTSAQPPENIKRQFGELSRDLTIVDCYTNRVEEVDTIKRSGNVITSPIEMSVVSVAISRGMEKDIENPKRAVVDILPTYLVFQTVEKIYLDLMEIIDDFRKSGYTVLFSLNPYYIKDEGAISTLEELFDGIIHAERTADSSGIKDEINIKIDKMANQRLTRSVFNIDIPGRENWSWSPEMSVKGRKDQNGTPVEA